MSVLSCCRKNCRNIMCDRLSDRHGYICDTCFEELVNSGPATNVEEFLQTEPRDPYDDPKVAALARYERIFPYPSRD